MKIFVCIKQVPDTETKVKFNADSTGLDGAGIKWVMNPYDEFAVEEAIRIREKNAGSQIFAISVGPKARVVESLRTALAMGVDEAIVINGTDNQDAFSTAKALSQAIAAEGGAQLILLGKLAIDQNQSSVGPMLAEFLNLPHVSVVSKIEGIPGALTAERDVDGGAKEIFEVKGPAIITANKGLNMPRYASLPGIMKAKKKVIKEIEMATLGITDADTKVKYKNYSLPPEKPAVKLISGDSATQAAQLVQLLRDEAKVL